MRGQRHYTKTATIVSMHTESYIHHGHTVYEHRLAVPLDHLRPVGEDNPTIEVFAREVVRKGREDSPYAVFLQGGPGYPSPRFGTFSGGWMNRLLQDYRVVLLDQRGTGQSTRMDAQALSHLDTDEEKAAYLRYFRQDQIVYDAEALRRELCGDEPWTTLGQSFGGFITTSYLSLAPQGLKASLITGGLPGLVHVDDIYRLTYERTAARNRAYFRRHPGDERTVRELCAHLADTEETLPTGERLIPRALAHDRHDAGRAGQHGSAALPARGSVDVGARRAPPLVPVPGGHRLAGGRRADLWRVPGVHLRVRDAVSGGHGDGMGGRSTG